MRKSSSFMCVLVVLLAGYAEATRPIAKEALFGVAVFGAAGVKAWTPQAGCRPFNQIYTSGEDMVNRMWNDAFEVKTDGSPSYMNMMWWFEGGEAGSGDFTANPNDLITQALGGTVPNQCHLAYYHKDVPPPEGADFTECHPWHASCARLPLLARPPWPLDPSEASASSPETHRTRSAILSFFLSIFDSRSSSRSLLPPGDRRDAGGPSQRLRAGLRVGPLRSPLAGL